MNVISLLRVGRLLAFPDARVLLVVDTKTAALLMSVIRARAAEDVKPWADARVVMHSERAYRLEMPAATLWIRTIDSVEEAKSFSGAWYSNILFQRKTDPSIVEVLRPLVRMPGTFTGSVFIDVIEETRKHIYVEQEKEPDDETML